MLFSKSALTSAINNECSAKSELTVGEGLTSFIKGCNRAIAEAITEVHNQWQSSVTVSNVLVNGGICSPNGPLSAGIGIAPIGSLSQNQSNTVKTILGKYVIEEFQDLTEQTKGYMEAIGTGYENAVNAFLDSSTIMNIIVSGGSCTCTYSPGPIPGSYSGGTGTLSSLSGFMVGAIPTESVIKLGITNNVTSHFYTGDGLTPAFKAHIAAIAKALGDYFDQWLSNTGLKDLQVSGGTTIPAGPIIAATGNSGVFK